MKKLIIFTLLFLLVSFAFTQDALIQNTTKITNLGQPDYWYGFPSTVVTASTDSLWFHDMLEGETVYTWTFQTMPRMFIFATVVDSGAAMDTTNFKTEMWGGMSQTVSTFSFIKTLKWTKENASAIDSVNAAGYWWCDMWDTTKYPSLNYFRLKIINGVHVVGDTIDLKLEFKGLEKWE